MQPVPGKTAGGDCFACALTAGLRWLFPEKSVTFDATWQLFVGEHGTVETAWPGQRRTLYRAIEAGYPLEVTCDIVEPRIDPERWPQSFGWSLDTGRYTNRLEGWLRGGWVAFSDIALHGKGPLTADLSWNHTDHVVLVDGIRYGWERMSDGTGTVRDYVHVVCSVKGAYWLSVRDFTVQYGAGAWWLARRDNR